MTSYRFATYGRLSTAFKRYIDDDYSNRLSCDVFDSEDDLLQALPGYNAFAGFRLPARAAVSNLRWIHSFGAGVDTFLQYKASFDTSLILTRSVGNMGTRMAEYCLAYLLYDLKGIATSHQQQQQSLWAPLSLKDLFEQNVLVLGTGEIGEAIIEMLKPLCHRVIGVNRSGKAESHHIEIWSWEELLAEDLRGIDAIINTLPHTEQTKGLINTSLLEKLEGVTLINVGRGSCLDTEALRQALAREWVRLAVLDVFEEEPLPATSDLWANERVIITPHHASRTTAADVEESFREVHDAILHQKPSSLIVDINRGY